MALGASRRSRPWTGLLITNGPVTVAPADDAPAPDELKLARPVGAGFELPGGDLSDGLDEALDLPLKLRRHWKVRMSRLGMHLDVLHELVLGLNSELAGTVHTGIPTGDLFC